MENKFSDLPEKITKIIEQKIDEVAADCETYEEVRMKLIDDTNFFSGSVGYKLIEKPHYQTCFITKNRALNSALDSYIKRVALSNASLFMY
ncbi:hypothetical protein [Staphylococcus haemolyticus]|uniref:hypothetical protein n=1 Tax=Staphylococcus haemolyticus TaxID=1283 RepID=UPI0011582563|nr:hypothetical protein [Staphylococcus haemolyticus]